MSLKEQIVNLEKEIKDKIEQLNSLKEEDKKEEEIRKKKYILPKTDNYFFVDFNYTNGEFTAQKQSPYNSLDEENFYNSGNYFSDKDKLLAEQLSYRYNYLLKLSVYKRIIEPDETLDYGNYIIVYEKERGYFPFQLAQSFKIPNTIRFITSENCQEVCNILNLKGIV